MTRGSAPGGRQHDEVVESELETPMAHDQQTCGRGTCQDVGDRRAVVMFKVHPGDQAELRKNLEDVVDRRRRNGHATECSWLADRDDLF